MKRSLLIILGALLILGCQKEVYHNVTAAANPAEAGSVSPSSGPVLDGTSVSFKATPNGDYVFTGWSGSISGTENPKTVTVTQDMNVTANFTLRSYPLAITIEGDGTVAEKVVSTKSEHQSGTVVELTASPSDHWLFDHWDGDITGTTNPAQITVSSAKNVKAVFVEKTYPLNVEIEGEGAVSEKIIQTKATYQEGTVVELTANPSDGWSFDHWGGDLEGNKNPAQIMVSGEINVRAIFTKNEYSLNVKIEGPGVVNEYLIEQTKASLSRGQQVKLVAIPSDGAIFIGWSGSFSSTKPEIDIAINENTEVVAKFAPDVKQYPLPDLKTPSRCFQRVFPDLASDIIGATPTHTVYVDYNLDGYMDAVTFNTLWTISDRLPVGFYQGDPYKIWKVDEQNNNVLPGLIDSRKGIYGDYNNDGFPDMCLIGGGYDAEPYPGDYPLILMSNASSGKYSEVTFPDNIGFWHGGSSGDYDNDGDLDIFMICSWHTEAIMLVNDGHGNFTAKKDLFNQELRFGMYNTEMYDIDNDGLLDLVVGGHDHQDYKINNEYVNMPIVIWGDGNGFNSNDFVRLPKTPVAGLGIVNDFYFYDIDDDSKNEMILVRTGDGDGDPINAKNYEGWCFQILKLKGHEFEDITQKVMGLDNCYSYTGRWLAWMEILETENGVILYGQDCDGIITPLYKLENKKLIPYYDDPVEVNFNGLCIYSDGFDNQGHIDFGYDKEFFSGTTSIKFQDWPTWDGWTIEYPNALDLSQFERNQYCFEFAIKNSDPDLWIDFSFDTRDGEVGNSPVYHFIYSPDDGHNKNGEWELIKVPLSSLKCDEEWTGYYWNSIKNINILPGECHGMDFYLDEIRIRKILPN